MQGEQLEAFGRRLRREDLVAIRGAAGARTHRLALLEEVKAVVKACVAAMPLHEQVIASHCAAVR